MKGPLRPDTKRGSFRKVCKKGAWFMPLLVPWYILAVSCRNWLWSYWARDEVHNKNHQGTTSLHWFWDLFNPSSNLHLWPQQHVTVTLIIGMKICLLFVSNSMPHNSIASLLIFRVWETVSTVSLLTFSMPLLFFSGMILLPYSSQTFIFQAKNPWLA